MAHRVALGHQTVAVVEALRMDWDLAEDTDREVVDRTEAAEDTVKVVQAFQASLDQVQEEGHTTQNLCKSKY
jgi:hypothetical protein